MMTLTDSPVDSPTACTIYSDINTQPCIPPRQKHKSFRNLPCGSIMFF